MLQFLQPIWLWASTAVIIPVIIHLWNVTQGKTLKVGSIFLFAESAKAGAKIRKLTELLLLLLRCLLLIILAMFMAKPVWLQYINTKEKGWLLIPENELHEAYHAYQPLIDSLIGKGYILHDFDKSFRQEDLQKMLARNPDTIHQTNISYWALLQQASENILPDLPVYLFTDNKLKHFTGVRPVVSTGCKWYTFTGSDTASSWLEKAYQISADSIRFITGNSHSSGTQFSYQNLSLPDLSGQYKAIANYPYSAVLNNDTTQQANGVDTSSHTIVIYTKTLAGDAAYVEAAVKAINQFTQYNIKTKRCDAVKDIPDHYDWLFWLSDDTIPPTLFTNNVLKYEQGVPGQMISTLLVNDYSSVTTTENLLVYQLVQGNSSYQTIWQDGFGNPVLSLEKRKNTVYHFYSHFNPQWNDIVWSSQFPQALYELLFIKQNHDEANDKRIIDTSQVQPAFVTTKRSVNHINNADIKDIANWFWLAALIIFFTERILSFRTKNNQA